MATAIERIYTPPRLAKRWGVSPEKIVRWILAGELTAMNLAASVSGRPRYRITQDAVDAFERSRQVSPPLSIPRTKRRSLPTVTEFF